MSFDWAGFLLVAASLERGEGDETLRAAQCRSAISRAYYAAFCTARDHLSRSRGHDHTRQRGVHEYVRRQFQGLRNDRPEYQLVAAYLRRLQVARAEADYNAAWEADLGDAARTAIEDCRRVLRALDATRP